MSNIGKIKIVLPPNLIIKVLGWKLFVKGPYGEKTIRLPLYTKIEYKHSLLSLTPYKIKPNLYGSLQRKVAAFIYSIAYVHVKRLLFVGVGYRARLENQEIILRLGFSHEISLKVPSTIHVSIVKRNNVILKGNNLEEISQFAYRLRSFRRPEPFKGKGVVCYGETIRRKEGKKKKI